MIKSKQKFVTSSSTSCRRQRADGDGHGDGTFELCALKSTSVKLEKTLKNDPILIIERTRATLGKGGSKKVQN